MKKVLVVDDTKNIRMLLAACLEIEGYRVDEARDGMLALEKLEMESYDLIFLDIKLPGMSGTDVLRSIRAKGNNIPVIIMTAFGTVKNAVECTRLGAVHYLQKPFTADKVRSVLNSLTEVLGPDRDNKAAAAVQKLIEDGRFDQAYELLKKSLAQNPENGETYFLIGKLFEKQGNIEKARRFYKISGELSNESRGK